MAAIEIVAFGGPGVSGQGGFLGCISRLIRDVPLESGIGTFFNPYSYLVFRRSGIDLSLFDGVYCDGAALRLLLLLTGIKARRVSFDATTLAPIVFKDCEENGRSIFFIGARSEIIADSIKEIQSWFPNMRIVGARHGYFSGAAERARVIDELVELSPDVVVVGMGAPNQDCFLLDLKQAGWKGVGYTCGGFLHQVAGRGLYYYPRWIEKIGCRWLFRVWDEPRLLWRYGIDYPKFLFVFGIDLFRFWRAKRTSLD